jgi:hypothetical protein
MHPYVHDVLERNAREMRDRSAPHTRHLHEARADRAATRRIRRLTSARAFLVMLRRHGAASRGPASAGGHP